jgi:hypothetical protein
MSTGYNPPIYGVAYEFYICLVSQADTKLFKANPTLAAGDVQVVKDGGTAANLTTLPSASPASSKYIKVSLSATEMSAKNVTVLFSDAAGAEWCDLAVNVQPALGPSCAGTVGSASSTTSVVSSAMQPAGGATDQFKGRIMIFDADTTTAALRGQATDITASTNAATPTFTVSALTTAPVSGDTFRVY